MFHGWLEPMMVEACKKLGDVTLRALAKAREQAATQITIDLPLLFAGSTR